MDSFIKVFDDGVRSLAFNKFKGVMELDDFDMDVVYYPKSIAQRVVASKRGENSMEFINVWRESIKFSWDRQRSSVSRTGLFPKYNNDKTGIYAIKALPVDLSYNIWLWSKTLDTISKVMVDYILWQHSNPNLSLSFNDTYPLEIDLHFGEAVDESPVDLIFEEGVYFVAKLPLIVEAWLFDMSIVKIIKKITLCCYDNTTTEHQLLYNEIIQ